MTRKTNTRAKAPHAVKHLDKKSMKSTKGGTKISASVDVTVIPTGPSPFVPTPYPNVAEIAPKKKPA